MRPSDAIWRQWSWTTLAQVMACCLTAPSHYLNQCWLIIRGVLWHTSESSFAGIAQGIDSGYEFEKDILKNIFKSPRGQWVKWPITGRLWKCMQQKPELSILSSTLPYNVFTYHATCNENFKILTQPMAGKRKEKMGTQFTWQGIYFITYDSYIFWQMGTQLTCQGI